MVEVKIEDLNYTLPTDEIDPYNFNKGEWLKNHPIDYFQLLYLLFRIPKEASQVNNIPLDMATDITFQELYALTRLYIPDTLYKYVSFNDNLELNKKKILTLQNKKLFMAGVESFNDPFDCKAFFYDPRQLAHIERLKHIDGEIIKDFSAYPKGIALTENNTNCMPMWAHYANNHKGFCISYNMRDPRNTSFRGCTFPIQYTDERLDITSFMKEYAETILGKLDDFLLQGGKRFVVSDLSIFYVPILLFNVKHLSWAYEKEFRCSIVHKQNDTPYIDAEPNAIFIGLNCDQKYKSELINIAKQLSIPVYQMRFDKLSEQYALKAEEC